MYGGPVTLFVIGGVGKRKIGSQESHYTSAPAICTLRYQLLVPSRFIRNKWYVYACDLYCNLRVHFRNKPSFH